MLGAVAVIEGNRVMLRAVEENDSIAFHRWFNDPEVTRFLGVPFPALSLAQKRRLIESLRDDNSRSVYTILLKNATPIGICELREFDTKVRSCELAITIGEKQYWGQRYGGEAVELLLQIAFQGFNMHKVWLTCAAYNERGLRAYTRIGFREEGRLRDARFIDGCYHDTVVMSILEEEWRHKQQATTDVQQTT